MALRSLYKRAIDEPLLRILVPALQDPNADIRFEAAGYLRWSVACLGNRGTDSVAALPVLVELAGVLKNESGNLRDAVGNALKKIDPVAAAKAGID